ncbi:MAG: mechanosensitive ion channel, partial [Desulfobacteraceae bacterium]|nr:mechanosensitive ion channel [Desulfobacteraceae bacterium]
MEKNLSSVLRKGSMVALVLLLCLPMAVSAADSGKTETAVEIPALPETLTAEDVDRIVAGLSDEQARRLLIQSLEREAKEDAAATSAAAEGGVAGLLKNAEDLVDLFQVRIAFLRSGGTVSPEEVSGLFTFLGGEEKKQKNPAVVIFSVGMVLIAGFFLEGIFLLYTKTSRTRLVSADASRWRSKLGILSARGLLDLLAIVLFVIGSLALFFLLLEGTVGERVLLATYLAALAAIQLVWLISRFLLTPGHSRLRLFPIGDEAAVFLHRWIVAFAAVYVIGFFTCGVVRLAGATELAHVKATSGVSLLMAVMLIWMILAKRKEVAEHFSRGVPENSLRYRLIQKWHAVAVALGLLLVALSIINRILGLPQGQGILTLLMVPLYFLLDWLLREALDKIFGIVVVQDEPAARKTPEDEAEVSDDEAKRSEPVEEGTLTMNRMRRAIRSGLRAALAALIVFWTLKIWGVPFEIGEAVAAGVFRILLVVLICYVFWVVVSAAIQRRLQQEMPDPDKEEEMEEGSAGGSRIVTLLILLRKFMAATVAVLAALMILSALGVNIGPLIAGAGVFGLAIGFGAQTLVKDIISGVFFLIDDAFRVGDYVEVAGTKGSVEHISIRSLRLRHPRGQVNFIPFGDIATVTNLSRDYIVTKLDFRVRYDTDVEKVRKIIKKKVYKEIIKDPELADKLLDKIKSQGVREMDDSAMIMRVKYKTRPGDQFAIRKHVYRLMQEAFREAGIEFAHRNVT